MVDNFEGFPMAGKTDHDDEDVLIQVAGGRASMVPRAARRLSTDAKLELADFVRLVSEIERLTQDLPMVVHQLRHLNVSWSTIGWACGLTGEAARKRWADFEVVE